MNTLTFDIAQFFLSLNYYLLLLILRKAGCNSKVEWFFSNYLVCKKTQYCWNNISSQFFNIDIGIEWDSALFPILSVLYISLVFHILENYLKIFSNSFLFYSYNIVSFLLEKFSLILEHGKTEVFHFSRSYEAFNPPSLDLSVLGGPSLRPKNT